MGKTALRKTQHPEKYMRGAALLIEAIRRIYGSTASAEDVGQVVLSIAHAMGSPQMAEHTQVLSISSLYTWCMNNMPMYVLEEELAWALVNTRPPMETFDLLPRVPVSGMYVAIPPIFTIYNNQSGHHKIEGFYLSENLVRCYADPAKRRQKISDDVDLDELTQEPGVTIVAVGEDKQADYADKNKLAPVDDALFTFHLLPGDTLRLGDVAVEQDGQQELVYMVTNLLYLLQRTKGQISEVREEAPPYLKGDDRAARRARARENEKGRSALSHTILRLSEKAKAAQKASSAKSGTEKDIARHIVAGHIHSYWVSNPEDQPVLSVKEGDDGKKKHLIHKWLLPYWRGSGEAMPGKTVLVKK